MENKVLLCVLLAALTVHCKHQHTDHPSDHHQHQHTDHPSDHHQHQHTDQHQQGHEHGGLHRDIRHIMDKLDGVEKRLRQVEQKMTCPQQQMLSDQPVHLAPHVCDGIAATLDGYLQKLTGELDERLGASSRPHHQVAAAVSSHKTCVPQPKNCAEVYDGGNTESGVYVIYVPPSMSTLKVYCDLHAGPAGGWTVIQKRYDGSVNFTRNWAEYAGGFGEVAGEHWLGNKYLHLLTTSTVYKLWVELEDFEGQTAEAEYSSFHVESEEDDYRLTLGDYWGSAGDSINGRRGYLRADGMRFSTYDRDNDKSTHHMAEKYGGGWWYNQHTFSTVNGRYVGTGAEYRRDMQAIIWSTWRGYHAIKAVSMKIKPDLCPCT